MYGVVGMQSLYILRLDPPTNAAIGPSPAQRRAATSENPTTCTLPHKDSPHSITERRVPELIPVLGSQPAGDVSHKPSGRLPLLSARPAVTQKRAATDFAAW